MKISEEAVKELKRLYTARERVISEASQPIEREINAFIRGMALGLNVDMDKSILDVEKMEFIPRPTKEQIEPKV